ncbi:MAG: substrate-binding domain-containing protein [Burkholderiales bacterium]|nr:substrate-binding domain-containing protein [Burkholderiales bacterium]
MNHRLFAAFALLCCAAAAYAKDITIAHIYSKTGPFEAYGVDSHRGLELGLQYATSGTMAVSGNKIVLIARDDQGKADIGRAHLAAAYQDEKADIAVGAISSAVTLAMMPIAEEHKKLLIVDSSVADSITGDKWSRYVFRTARNSTQDALTNAVVVDKPGTYIATLAQDYAFGRDGIKAFRQAIKNAKIVREEYLPANATDFTGGAVRLIDALKDKPGKKIVFIYWAGAGNPLKIAELDLKKYGIEIATGGNTLPALTMYKQLPGLEGSIYYYYGIPKNKANDWLMAEHYKRYKSPPDFFTVCGMAAGIAIVEALKKTNGDTDTEKLIATLEGMSFDTPKGKMTLRKEDHQAMMPLYHFKIKNDPALAWAVPELVREIKAEEINVPIRNKR